MGRWVASFFTTAYNEYAVKAFRLNVIHFLLKPVDPDDLEVAVNKAKQQKQLLSKEQIEGANNMFHHKSDDQLQRLALATSEGIHFVDIKDVVWIEASGAYTKFQIAGHRPIMVSKVLKEYEELLTSLDFIRVHQSNLVNMRHIKKYVKGDGGQLWMTNGTEIEVSRRKKDDLAIALKKMTLK